MLIERGRIAADLLQYLSKDNKEHFDLIVDLVCLATTARELGFQFPEEDSERERFFQFIKESCALREATGTPFLEQDTLPHDSSALEDPVFPHEPQLTVRDIAQFIDIYYDRTSGDSPIWQHKLLEWLGDAWDLGHQQRKVYHMEGGGNIVSRHGIIQNFPAGLVLFGKRKGLLSAS